MFWKVVSKKFRCLLRRKSKAPNQRKMEMHSNYDEISLQRMHLFLLSRRNPTDFSATENSIRTEFKLYQRRYDDTSSSYKLAEDLQILAANNNLSFVFMFHGDFRVREAALKLLDGPIEIPVVVYGLVARLNDWVPSVREAAKQAFDRCFPATPAVTLVPAVWMLILNAGRWRRWSNGYSDLLLAVAQREDVIKALAERVASSRTAGTGTIIRTISLSQHIDGYLEHLAANAVQPHIRALTLSYLSANKVWWPTGALKKVWIDKSMGDYKVVADFASRPISVIVDLVGIIAKSVSDRSAIVRREALDAMAMHRTSSLFQELISDAISRLADDPNPSIRSRLEFLKNASIDNH